MMQSWTMRLIAANVVVFFLSSVVPGVKQQFALVPAEILQYPWTLVTYMFLHADVFHILFNMLGLFFFGPRLEMEMGGRDFLLLYFIAGMSGALLSYITPHTPIIGASGAVFGVFLGFARFWPREQILIWGIIPVEARTLVIIMTAMSVWGGFSGGGNTAHWAHLGGFVGGFLYLWLRDRRVRERRLKFAVPVPSAGQADIQRWRSIDRSTMHEVNRTELERILAKIDTAGVHDLTPQERQFLERFSAL
jgi:membrane associated rhomboid family serine protease